PDARVIQPGRDRVRRRDLASLVLEEVAHRAVQDAGPSGGERRGVAPRLEPRARGLDADQLDTRLVDEGVEDAHRVRAATDAGDDGGREPPLALLELKTRLAPDHRLEIP